MTKQEYIKQVTEKKRSIEGAFEEGLRQVQTLPQTTPDQIKARQARHENVNKEAEAATKCLCDEIEGNTGIKDVFKRNTDAVNHNRKNGAWAEYVLTDCPNDI